MSLLPPPPALVPMTHIDCEVRPLVTLGPGPYGERRYVPLGGGTVRGPELNGTLVVDNTPLENYWERGQPLPAVGPIELQNHGNYLKFRNIYIRELK